MLKIKKKRMLKIKFWCCHWRDSDLDDLHWPLQLNMLRFYPKVLVWRPCPCPCCSSLWQRRRSTCTDICLSPLILDLWPRDFHFDRKCKIRSTELSTCFDWLMQQQHLKLLIRVHVWQKAEYSSMLMKGPCAPRRLFLK